MRSPQEIAFRLRQELSNLAHFAFRRRAVPIAPSPLPGLPAEGPPARRVERIARLLLRHRFPLLGYTIETGPEIDWRRDAVNGRAAGPLCYFRFVPYLDFGAVGDHKVIWELNRHQHWVTLAQAFLLTKDERFLNEIWAQFESWRKANPFLRGINWTSALEVAFRALSWIWVYHLIGSLMPEALRRSFVLELYRHGLYLESNLSVYFSPNTHLLGEAVALHALGALFPEWPRAGKWRRVGGEITLCEAHRQVQADGSHFEQSTYYHVYALDMLLFHARLAGVEPFRATLERMAEYLTSVAGPMQRLPLIGDDDGGRFFHPYGPRERFGRATLAVASDLLGRGFESGAPAVLHREAGLAVMTAGDLHVIVDAGPFGPGAAGHSHSDTLSVVVRAGEEDILIDPGTYTYVGDPRWRDWFRGSIAHNTTRVDGRDDADPAGPFRWRGRPRVEIKEWRTGGGECYLDAVCNGRRRQVLLRGRRLSIVDLIEMEGEHRIEQFWHLGASVVQAGPGCFQIGRRAQLTLSGPGRVELSRDGWRSRTLGHKTHAPLIRVWVDARGPVRLEAAIEVKP